MNKKTLLVLAASRYQLDTIRCAQSLGYRVVTTDNRPDNPGHALSDRAYGVDTRDGDGVLAIARAEGIAGVISPCTDAAMPTLAHIAARLGLPGPTPQAVAICTSKLGFRHFLQQHGFAVPQVIDLTDGKIPELDWSTSARILKPDCSSGAKGVFIVRSADEVRQRLPDTLAHSLSGRALLETFIPGTQHTLEGILNRGAFALACLTDRLTPPHPFATTLGHLVPSAVPAPVRQQALSTILDVCHRLGITDGPIDCDLVIHDGQTYMLELSPRMGGNSLGRLVTTACDVDLVSYSVRFACGDAPSLPADPQPRPTAVLLLGCWRAGRLHYDVDAATRLRAEPWVTTLEIDQPLGAAVEPFINGRHRLGEALIIAPDRDTLAQRIRILQDGLGLESV